jgi:hypothetical protein
VTATSTATSTSAPETFVTVPGDRHSEVAHTLAEPVPKALSLVDQLGLWGNLGVSLLGFTGAILAYLFIQLIRQPLPAFTHGTWSGFWVATDTVVAAAISFASMAADYTRHSRSEAAAFNGAFFGYGFTQGMMLLPWAAGFVTYQLINPGYISWWVSAWTSIANAVHFTPASWMSASICSFVVAAVVTLIVGGLTSLIRPRGGDAPVSEQHTTAA